MHTRAQDREIGRSRAAGRGLKTVTAVAGRGNIGCRTDYQLCTGEEVVAGSNRSSELATWSRNRFQSPTRVKAVHRLVDDGLRRVTESV
jgi:hypothetical protein